MIKFIKRPAILLALLVLVGFVIFLFISYENLSEQLAKVQSIVNLESVEKAILFEHHKQHSFESEISNNQSDIVSSYNQPEITLGYCSLHKN